MKGLVIFTALVAVTSAQEDQFLCDFLSLDQCPSAIKECPQKCSKVNFPGADVSSSTNNDSTDVDSQLNGIFSTLNRDLPSQPTNDNRCSLPDGSLGNCVRLSQCSSYNDLFSNLKNQNTVNFMRERICRLLTNSVQICCPLGNETGITPQTAPKQSQTTLRPSTLPPLPSGSPNTLFPSNCGESFGDRIIQGEEVAVGAYPWLVALGRPDIGVFDVNCGGTLITSRHVLTAAHCFAKAFKPTHARLGEHDVTSDNDQATPQDHLITRIVLDSYNDTTNENDIALLTLDRDVVFTTKIRPICLPFRPDLKDNSFIGNRMDIVGWGRTSHSTRETSPVPLEAKVEVVTLESCQQAYRSLERPVFVNDQQICAGTGGADTCRGDSGGPLHYLDRQMGRYYLAGITSFGKECGNPEFPGVYTRVGPYLKWLETNVK